MARRVVKEYVEDTGAVPPDAVGLDPDAVRADELRAELSSEDVEELFRVTDELRATAGVRLQFVRVLPVTPGKNGYVGEMTPAEFTLERVRQQFGPGKYRVRCMGPRGYVPGGGSVEIAEPAPATGAANGPLDLNAIFQQIEQRQEQRKADAWENRKLYLTLLAPALPELIRSVFQRGPSMTDLIGALSGLKQLAPQPSENQLEKTLEIFFRGLETAKTLNSGGETNWLDIIRDVAKDAIPTLRPALERLAQARVVAVQNPQPMSLAALQSNPALNPNANPSSGAVPSAGISDLAAPSVVPDGATPIAGESGAPAGTSPEGNTGSADMIAMIEPILRKLANELQEFAENAGDAELCADVLLAKVPRWLRSQVTPVQIKEWLTRADWWQFLVQFAPTLKPYQAFCDDVRVVIVTQMDEEISPSPESSEDIGQ